MKRLPLLAAENLGTMAERAAEAFPGATVEVTTASPYLAGSRLRISYPELAGWIAAVAERLARAGVGPGDRVAVLKRSHVDTIVMAAALVRLGAVPALVSTKVPAEHLPVLLDRLQPTSLLVDGEGIESLSRLDREHGPRLPLDEVLGVQVESIDWRSAPPPHDIAPGVPMAVTHTSGTTDVPKLVVHSATTLAARCRPQLARVPVLSMRSADRYACAIPYTHARGLDMFLSVLHLGTSLLAISDTDRAVVEAALAEFSPTIFEAVPDLFLRWEPLARSSTVFRHVRLFGNTFDAIHPRTVRAFLDSSGRRVPIWGQAYGQSEAGGVTVSGYTRRRVRRDRNEPLRSVGRPFMRFSNLRIVDPETKAVLPRRRVGRIEVSSPGIALTYLGQEELFAKRRRAGWWTMGDIGYIDRWGTVHLLDREIDHLDGVDSALALEDRLLDEIEEATEIALVADRDDRPVAVVCLADDQPLTDARATAALRAAGAPELRVVQARWEDVPRTSTFKVRRAALARLVQAGVTDGGAGSGHVARLAVGGGTLPGGSPVSGDPTTRVAP